MHGNDGDDPQRFADDLSKIDTCQFFRLALRYVNPHEHHSRPCAALV